MEDLFKKVLYTGVGLVSVTAEKFQESIDELVKDNKLSREEGKKVVNELFENTESKREEFEAQLKNVVEEVVNRVKLVSQKDFDALEKRLEALEALHADDAPKTTTKTAAKPAPKRKTAPKKKDVASE